MRCFIALSQAAVLLTPLSLVAGETLLASVDFDTILDAPVVLPAIPTRQKPRSYLRGPP